MRTKLRILSLLNSRFSAVSQYTSEQLLRYGVKKRNLCCIGNPVSLPRACAEDERNSVRSRFSLPLSAEDHWLWIHVANLRPVKDQATLLRGFAASRALINRAQSLLIIGDGPERKDLETLTKDLGIQAHVHFLGHQDDIVPYLCAADGFILSSRSEAMPMALLEAGAAGLLMVSSEVGGVGEVVLREQSGYLFPIGDYSALARRIEDALSDPIKSARYANVGRQIVETHFSIEAVTDAYISVY